METIRRKNDGWTTYQVRKIAHVSVRRVNQIWASYQSTGLVPELGKKMGRPTKPLEIWELQLVEDAWIAQKFWTYELLRKYAQRRS